MTIVWHYWMKVCIKWMADKKRKEDEMKRKMTKKKKYENENWNDLSLFAFAKDDTKCFWLCNWISRWFFAIRFSFPPSHLFVHFFASVNSEMVFAFAYFSIFFSFSLFLGILSFVCDNLYLLLAFKSQWKFSSNSNQQQYSLHLRSLLKIENSNGKLWIMNMNGIEWNDAFMTAAKE